MIRSISVLVSASLLSLAACGSGGSDRPDEPPDASTADAGPQADAAPACDPAFGSERMPDDGSANTELRGLHGTAPDDVWAGGPRALRIYHRDAAGWRDGGFLHGAVNAVWALARNNAYAVGPFGHISHWNGTEWRTEQRADSPTNTIFSLDDVHALSDDNAWAVGEHVVGQGQRAPLLMKRVGGVWEKVPVTPNITGRLDRVWVESPTRRWVTGIFGIALLDDADLDGTPWTVFKGAVTDVAIVDGEVWAMRAFPDARGALCRYLGDAERKFVCTPFPGLPTAAGKAFAVVDGKRLLAVSEGPGALLAELRDGAWTAVPGADLGSPLSLFGTGDHLWIGGTERMQHRACRP